MKKISFLTFVILLAISLPCFADTIHVPGNQPTIQAGIDAAANGDVVLVAPGTYVENINFMGKAITVKSQLGAADTVIDGGSPSDPHHGSVVTFSSGEENSSVLQGFTLYNGTGTYDEYASEASGGGVFCENSSPTLMDIHLFSNKAAWDGGGLYCLSGDPILTGCIFTQNKSFVYNAHGHGGGGMYNKLGYPELNECLFVKNESTWNGGGFLNTGPGGQIVVNDCRFVENNAWGGGGGLYTQDGPILLNRCTFTGNSGWSGGACSLISDQLTLANCSFINNDSDYGGGIYYWRGELMLIKCSFIGNKAEYFGGAIYMWQGLQDTLYASACTFIQNESAEGGAFFNRSNLHLINCTLFGNRASVNGGGVYNLMDGHLEAANCIFWDNVRHEIFNDATASCDVKYSCIKHGYPGVGNIDTDPLFAGPAIGDIHLTYNSPCRDVGDRDLNFGSTDFEGDPWGSDIDMGADEFYNHLYITGDATPGGDVQGKLVGIPNTWPVGLFLGSGVLNPPMQHGLGEFYLEAPWMFAPLVSIPSSGVLVIPETVPELPVAPYDIPMQALIGWELTNLFVLEVR